MNGQSGCPPVVVGIDGSDAAADAALWAADEAIGRDAPLRLIFIIDDERLPGTVHSDGRSGEKFATRALDHLAERMRIAGKPVSTAAAILRGHSAAVLIEASRTAALLCVGSTGIGWVASKVFGSTAQAVAEGAHCPVAIVRRTDGHTTQHAGGIVVVGFRRAQNDDLVFRAALAEARLRKAPLIAVGKWKADFGESPYAELERCVEQWTRRYTDVHVYPVPSPGDLRRFLADNNAGDVELAVIGKEDVDQMVSIIGPQGFSLLEHGRCSVLVAS